MFTKFKSNNSIVFLDPHNENLPELQEGTKVDVILSPSLYWVKKLTLPVKYERDAKKLLPSIFEDNLPEAHYNYAVFKEGDEFIAFAYEDRTIIEALKQKNISTTSVQNVYFAQTELLEKTACKINATEVLASEGGVVFVAPTSLVETEKTLSLENITLSKKRIQLQQFSHIIDNSSIYKIAALLSLFIVLIAIEIFVTTQKIQSVEEQKEKLFTEYKLYPTMMQNRSILDGYKTTFEKQTKLREVIAALLKLKLEKDQKLSQIKLKNKLLEVRIEGVDDKSAKKIISQLAVYKSSMKTESKNNKLKLEVRL